MRTFHDPAGGSLLAISLGVLLAFGALLVSGCSAKEDAYDSPETTMATKAPASLNYVALGDSLAVGLRADRGYVDRYTDYLKADTGAQVSVVNLGQSGETSSQLLYALRNDSFSRRAISTANVITFNIGINDLGHASEAYENGTCGGDDNQECLRAAVETYKENWDSIIAELLGLCSTSDTVIRTAGIGYTPYVFIDEAPDTRPSNDRLDSFRVLKPYVDEVNRHVAATATNNGIPYAEVYLDEGEISPDGVHPNDEGYQVIADQLRELGYSPLK